MKRVITAGSVFGAVSAALFVITKILIVEVAIIYIIIDYFRVGKAVAIVLIILVSVPALWACVQASILCWKAETDPANNDYATEDD